MQIVIEIDEARYKDIQRIAEVQLESNHFQTAEQIIAKGVPIEQEPKTEYWTHDGSHWIKESYIGWRYECPVCGHVMVSDEELGFCPSCGADMRGEEHE